MKATPILITDFYKLTHMMQYPEGIAAMTAYMVPRFSRLKEMGIDEMVVAGIVPYVRSFVLEAFDNDFFGRPFTDIAKEVYEVLDKGLGYDSVLVANTLEKLKKLHDKKHLPIEVRGLPEGAVVPMNCPFIEVRCNDPDVPWAGQIIEASLSAAIWHPCVAATIARKYRQLAEEAYRDTCEDSLDPMNAMCDFSMRGQESIESAVAASAAWLTAMNNSSTVAARSYIKEFYNLKDYECIAGLTSTEHSVMTTHAVIDGMDETNTFEKLFAVYENASFAAVCDSYDFWNVLTNILPKFKNTIRERGNRGKFIGVRHDSADPVEAVCGIPTYNSSEVEITPISNIGYEIKINGKIVTNKKAIRVVNGAYDDIVYRFVKGEGLSKDEESYGPDFYTPGPVGWEEKGMVETMYELFGGSTNSKGYKVLNPGIKAVYGDSITVTRAKHIFDRLKDKGFAASNVSLGVGSFSFQAIEGADGALYPFTRDTFSIAMKCTHAKLSNGEELLVFKNPVGFSEKKSLKGLCSVKYNYMTNKVESFEDNLYEREGVTHLPYLYYRYTEGDSAPFCAREDFSEIRYRIALSVGAAEPVSCPTGCKSSFNLSSVMKGLNYFHKIERHFKEWAKETNTDKFIVGMSGGKDSTIVAMLIMYLFGKDSLKGICLPERASDDRGAAVCKFLDISYASYGIGDILSTAEASLSEVPNEQAKRNLPPRIRMALLFAEAQCIGAKVINTSNLSEDTVGWATQFGDNAGCYAPIQDFTVTEVKDLGMYLAYILNLNSDIAKQFIEVPPSDDLCGTTDEDALGFSYADLDRLIRKGEGTDEFKEKILSMYKKNKFKTDIVQMPKPDSGLPNFIKSWS